MSHSSKNIELQCPEHEQKHAVAQESVSWDLGSAERKIKTTIDSNCRENHCALSSLDRQRFCGRRVMEAGSVRTGMEPKIFTATSLNSLMVAAGHKTTMALGGREASAAKPKYCLVQAQED